MNTATLRQTWITLNSTALLVLLGLILPYISGAELQPMSETELKAVTLNDYVQPVDIMIIKTDEVNSYRREDARTLTMTRVEAPVIIDAERLIEDLMTQYEHIGNGNGSVEGFYPILTDPSYLIKQ